MSRHRDIKLDKYEIDKFAYRELLNFCRQYPEKKDKLKEIRGISLAPMTGMPRGQSVGNPTERKALRAEKLSEDCEMIEKTAIEAGPEIHTWLLRNVTEESCTWEVLNVPVGRRQFYEYRRRFFYLLALKRGMV
jgi:hypothetical protein